MATKAELVEQVIKAEARIAELHQEIAERQASWDAIVVGTGKGSVNKAADGGGTVVLQAGLITANEWIDAVARVSVGGANGENLAAIRHVHLG